jgi:vesicle coat complex subunit
MAKSNSAQTLKKLIDSNIKTQESVSAVVSTVKELIRSLKEVGEEEAQAEEIKIPLAESMQAISDKLDMLMQQHMQLLKAVNDLAEALKPRGPPQAPMLPRGQIAPPPSPPPEWRRL